MRYKNDYMNTVPSDLSQQYKPRNCGTGTYNMGMPLMGTQQMNGSTFGAQPMAGTLYGAQPLHGALSASQQALPALPTGYPTGTAPAPLPPATAGIPTTVPSPAVSGASQVPTTVESILFTPGFLRTQIGRRVRVEFLIGTSNLTDRTGTLVAVGASYIVIQLIDSDDLMMCDIYSIKFVTIIL